MCQLVTESFHVGVIWNRESCWCPWGRSYESLAEAIKNAQFIKDSGDGVRVKSARVMDQNRRLLWIDGKVVPSSTPLLM